MQEKILKIRKNPHPIKTLSDQLSWMQSLLIYHRDILTRDGSGFFIKSFLLIIQYSLIIIPSKSDILYIIDLYKLDSSISSSSEYLDQIIIVWLLILLFVTFLSLRPLLAIFLDLTCSRLPIVYFFVNSVS